MEIVLGIILLWGGYEWGSKSSENETVIETPVPSLVSEEPVFERGRYYPSGEGYYISNLTTKPTLPLGCHKEILTADLSQSTQDGVRDVKAVDISCEG